MKAMSIRQPWATAIATNHPDAKRVENRGRPTNHRGPIAIHASLTPDRWALLDPRIIKLLGNDRLPTLPTGAVIAVADLVDCHEAPWPHEQTIWCCLPWGERWYNPDELRLAWHLVLDNVRVLDQPVPAKGQLGVPWTLPDDIAERIDQIRAGMTPAP